MIKQVLIKKYHTIASRLNMGTEERKAFLSSWNVESSKDMSVTQLRDACNALSGQVNSSSDKWRKRVIAAVGGYLKLTGRANSGIDYIKNIACRATKCDDFNRIPIDKLRSCYNSFTHQSKVFEQTGEIINNEMDHLQFNN